MQAQDRCHRIGQTREVHIYRLVSESTIEENILHKSDQKRQLDHLAIQSGGFNTDFLQKFNPRELLGIQGGGLEPSSYSLLPCCRYRPNVLQQLAQREERMMAEEMMATMQMKNDKT